ncbi:amidohydrolase family protein [Microbaculum sp. FT89]|uniref:amidohydrolase family protein n=1 Tax=Microbaculum sp. FT89 TaxID=3447298 RepID=UPI003F538C7D
MTQLIDAHVHFYTARDLARAAGPKPYSMPAPHTLTDYLDTLIDAGIKPELVHNAHLSILPDSENVFASFHELDTLQKAFPARYGGIAITGTILADPAYATSERLAHPRVKGIRVVLHDTRLEDVPGSLCAGQDWNALLGRLRSDQHLHVYAKDPRVNLVVLRRIPDHVPLIIDHLGTCHPERGTDDPGHIALVDSARARGNTVFKGPGYRTATNAEVTLPFLLRILDALGPDQILLQASDAPHVGLDQSGRPYGDQLTPLTALEYTARLAGLAASATRLAPQSILQGARSWINPMPMKAPS